MVSNLVQRQANMSRASANISHAPGSNSVSLVDPVPSGTCATVGCLTSTTNGHLVDRWMDNVLRWLTVGEA
jgi:hypothetical protein